MQRRVFGFRAQNVLGGFRALVPAKKGFIVPYYPGSFNTNYIIFRDVNIFQKPKNNIN